jgi:hypothetical protein
MGYNILFMLISKEDQVIPTVPRGPGRRRRL